MESLNRTPSLLHMSLRLVTLLSFLRCLSSFEEQQPASSAAAAAGPSQPVDQPAEGDQPQEEAEPVAGPSSGTLNNSSGNFISRLSGVTCAV